MTMHLAWAAAVIVMTAACARTETSPTSAPPFASFNTRMDAGRQCTIVIVGNARSAPALEAFQIEDALSP